MSLVTNNEELNKILEAIEELPISKDEQEKSVTITENGLTEILPDEGKTLSTVAVNVDVHTEKEEQEKTIEITENGTTEVLPDDGKVLSKVTVNVEVASSGGNENFVGITLSEFNYRKAPLVADMRSLPINGEFGGFPYLFANTSTAGNGGFYAHLRDVYVPSGLTAFSAYMFSNCGSLKNIIGDCTSINDLQISAFQNCVSLTDVPYMPKLGYVNNNVFTGCTGLTEFKFYSKPHTLKAASFANCSNLLDIFVPWEEGAVANAPWGATKATIHYNTTYDENHNPIVTEE